MMLSTPTLPGDPARRSVAALVRSNWTLGRGTIADIALGGNADAEVRRAYIRFLAEVTTPETAASYLEAEWGPGPELGSITCPTLVVATRRRLAGGRTEASQALAAAIPGARLIATDAVDESAAYYGSEFLADDPPAPDTNAASEAVPPAQNSGALQTIVFTDIEANTELLQRLGDARWRALLREHETIIRAELAKHGGAEIKTMGDAFMASFGSAARALECAVALQRAFAEHNTAAEHPLRVRIGVNAGEPIAEADDLFGTSVTMASRIMGQAQGGEVLVSDVVRQLVAGKGFLFADRGDAVLRGFEDAVRLWQLRWQDDG
jgi:class 3 adenylate cyclase